MDLNKNELFVVTRGPEKPNIYAQVAAAVGREPSESLQTEYSRQFDGCVFRALVVNFPMVAARIEAGPCCIGTVLSLDVSKIWRARHSVAVSGRSPPDELVPESTRR